MKIENSDCYDFLQNIQTNSIDCIIIDPPYGTTPIIWDNQVDFEKLWKELNRVAKDNSAILIFAQEPFATYLRMSNIKYYRYDWYWVKERLTNVFQVKRRPGKTVENICVFYKKQPVYNPQKSKHLGKIVTNKIGENAGWSVTQSGYNQKTKPFEYIDDGTRHPTQVLRINRDNQRKLLHPTQKPLELIEYLIKTYTNEGDTVMDCFLGSGTTAVACKNTGRNFVGCEINKEYYEKSLERLNSEPQEGNH